MSGEKDALKEDDLVEQEKVGGAQDAEVTQSVEVQQNARIQFTADVRPGRSRTAVEKDVPISSDVITTSRRRSLSSLPPIISEKEKSRREREKEEDKHVDIDEHRMSHQDVAERYKTRIDLEKPGDSFGLTSQQAEELLLVT
jgi:sodium/potassium-transporting ATPase subunit alpha